MRDQVRKLKDCMYYMNNYFSFMHYGGKCWGECKVKREGRYYSDPNYYLAMETWHDEIALCEGHWDYPWSYLEKYRLVEEDDT